MRRAACAVLAIRCAPTSRGRLPHFLLNEAVGSPPKHVVWSRVDRFPGAMFGESARKGHWPPKRGIDREQHGPLAFLDPRRDGGARGALPGALEGSHDTQLAVFEDSERNTDLRIVGSAVESDESHVHEKIPLAAPASVLIVVRDYAIGRGLPREEQQIAGTRPRESTYARARGPSFQNVFWV